MGCYFQFCMCAFFRHAHLTLRWKLTEENDVRRVSMIESQELASGKLVRRIGLFQ